MGAQVTTEHKPHIRQTYSLTAREYAFWLWGMFLAGLIIGCVITAWLP